jgi:cyclase
MRRTRVIPVLLLKGNGFYKTTKFSKPVYLGDPLNILRIFNEKEVDEILILDISATLEKREPNWDILEKMANECFMPLGYGGGINSINQIKKIIGLGFEKVCLNSTAISYPSFITQASEAIGSQSVVVCLDAKKSFMGGYYLKTHSGTVKTKYDPVYFAKEMQKRGAGEIIINSIDLDGTMKGYDLILLEKVAKEISIPIVACGGAQTVDNFAKAVIKCNISAVAAGSMFVFYGPHRAVLIGYPKPSELDQILP